MRVYNAKAELPDGLQFHWDLLERIETKVREKLKDCDPLRSSYQLFATDNDGTYDANSIEELRKDIDESGAEPNTVFLRASRILDNRSFKVVLREAHSRAEVRFSRVEAESPDEEEALGFVASIQRLVERTQEADARHADTKQRAETAAATPPELGGEEHPLFQTLVQAVPMVQQAPLREASPSWKRWINNSWVVTIVGGVIATIVVLGVLALVHRSHSARSFKVSERTNVRSSPAVTALQVASIEPGTIVIIDCQAVGASLTIAGKGTSNIWDHVADPPGFITDLTVQGTPYGVRTPSLPSCH